MVKGLKGIFQMAGPIVWWIEIKFTVYLMDHKGRVGNPNSFHSYQETRGQYCDIVVTQYPCPK